MAIRVRGISGVSFLPVTTTTFLGTLGVGQGGTNIISYTIGDLLYASAATTLSKLADVATGNALISGGVGVAPLWGKVGLTTHISGTLAVGNGGTNAVTFTANGVLYGNTTGAVLVTAQGAANTVLTANAGAPVFTASPTIGTSLTMGISSAASGIIRLPNNQYIIGRNFASTADSILVGIGTVDDVVLGSDTITSVINIRAANTVTLRTASTDRLIVGSTGNIGIGAAASVPLSVVKANTGGLGASLAAVRIANPSNIRAELHFSGAEAGLFAAISGLLTDSASNTRGDLMFGTRNASADAALTERMRITGAGNVGIGAAAPGAKLQVDKGVGLGAATEQLALMVTSAAATGTSTAGFGMNDGTNNALNVVGAGDFVTLTSAVRSSATIPRVWAQNLVTLKGTTAAANIAFGLELDMQNLTTVNAAVPWTAADSSTGLLIANNTGTVTGTADCTAGIVIAGSNFRFFTFGLWIDKTGVASGGNAIIVPNARFISSLDTGGAANSLIHMNASDQVVIAGTSSTTDIKLGRGTIALGGGAAPTLGTIGGSGPGTAAQAGWQRFVSAGGVAFYVPFWV